MHPSIVDVKQVACGARHTMVLTAKGQVFAWGRADNGRLGYPATRECRVPAQVPLPPRCDPCVIACGNAHSFAACENGQIYAWGWNQAAQLGIGSDQQQVCSPLLVEELAGRPTVLVSCGRDFTIFACGR